MYHGGDFKSQQDSLEEKFEDTFPGINFTMVVDYSKYHDVRIDNQQETDTLVPDITALQTAKAGDLLEYKPANFSKIYDGLVNSFSYIYDSSNLGGLDAPTSSSDLQYGWEWAAAMANQSISFNRGSHVANNLVTAQEKVIGVGTYAGASPIVYVGGNGTEYLTWGQRLAILAKAKNPVAAKLFMNWIVSTEVQESVVMETVRTDIAPSGSSHPWEIPEANLDAFPAFMANRTAAEQWRQTFALYFGEVQGEPTPGYQVSTPDLR
ncbi:hypothetical protein PHYSODRAFT_258178 [Phytophthora sojae]|uniref:Uncharacterized protein n=1 Tax=Phytophthora sojae (strain P6497) TaxID=1094619 RepID=G4YH53_PHYSP|nr:hypothetical protein PHYSODRAFT_258178 [Phytophthora sojae]EGZ28076.1 hypothetical protein PHYSODRAFT_258178 [Phytophthora sojae]|eukprot:XP_009515351.1 hypothetical protein PHYSODRAFT_258178 [Phytophthora sojae]